MLDLVNWLIYLRCSI